MKVDRSVSAAFALGLASGALLAAALTALAQKIEGTGVVPDVAVEGASAAPLEVPDPAKDAPLARALAALKR